MKHSCLITIAALFCGGALSTLWAEDWKTIDGKVYPEIKVIKAEPDAVTILYRDGGARIPLIILPAELQKRFNYDPTLAQAAADARAVADFQNARALRIESQQIAAKRLATLIASDPSPSSDATSSPATYADPTHHTMGELIDPSHRLRDDVSADNHYSMGGLARSASLVSAPPDLSHHTLGSLFGSGDPLAQ